MVRRIYMRIHITHINNTYNYGSFMMAITIIERLKREFKDVEIYVDSSSDKDLERIKLETGIERVYRERI